MGLHGTEEEAAAFAWAPGRRGEDGRARRHFEEHADRVGVPLGFRAGVADVMLELSGPDPVEGDAELWSRPRARAEKMGHGGVLLVLRKHGVDLP